MFTSNNYDYETPQWLYDHFNNIFHFGLDVCANKDNTKCDKYLSVKDNGLDTQWLKRNWMNPPYGQEIKKWVKKAYQESEKGNLTVCLLPSRTDTKWFQNYVMKADVVHFIKGRLKFINKSFPSYDKDNLILSPAPFPSCIVIFGLFNYIKE